MSGKRLYATAAEKQRAYRARLRAKGLVAVLPRAAASKPKHLSRPARLAAIQLAVRELADEYQAWRDALPENLSGSQLAERLDEVVGQLEAIAEDLDAVEPPRIGR